MVAAAAAGCCSLEFGNNFAAPLSDFHGFEASDFSCKLLSHAKRFSPAWPSPFNLHILQVPLMIQIRF
jgi:hypothetical protein